MSKKFLFLIIGCLALISLAGCKKMYVQDGDSNLIMSTNGLEETEVLSDLLARAENLSNMRYDVVSADEQITRRVWLKGGKMRVEADQTVTILNYDEHSMYIYMPAENKATKMSLGLGQEKERSLVDDVSDLDLYNNEIIGTETFDDKNCLIIKHSWGSSITSLWLWKKYGLPVKIETENNGQITAIHYKNFDFSVIPDNMFELPKDLEITDMSSLPELDDFKLPEIE